MSATSWVSTFWMGTSISETFISSQPTKSCARSSCTKSVIFFQCPFAKSASSMDTTCCWFMVEYTTSRVFALPLDMISKMGPDPSVFSMVKMLPLVFLNCFKLTRRRKPLSAWMESRRSLKELSGTGGIRSAFKTLYAGLYGSAPLTKLTPLCLLFTRARSNKSYTLLSSRLSVVKGKKRQLS